MASPYHATTLSTPYTLFPLSLSSAGSANSESPKDARRCFTSPVSSYSAKKRKRTGSAEVAESTLVAAAVDGEGVNVYDVRFLVLLGGFEDLSADC